MTMSGTKEDRTTSPELEENQAKEDILSKQSSGETSDSLDVKKEVSTKKDNNWVETTGSEQEKEVNEVLSRKIETSEAEKDENPDEVTEKTVKQDNPAELITAAEQEPIEKQRVAVEQDRIIAKDVERQKSEDQPGQTVSKDDSQDFLSNNSSEKDQSKQTIMKDNALQEVLNNIKTNDSPIQAVNELTDVKSFTVEWRPAAPTHCTVADTRSIAGVTENNSLKSFQESKPVKISATGTYVLETDALNGAETRVSGEGSDKVKPANLTVLDDLVLQESYESSSVLEQTVGKLKVSKINGTLSTTPEGISSVHTPAKVPLPSSAPPDYLKELLLRSQLNRRKARGGLNEMSFVPKRSPPPIFRSRRGRPIRRPNMPIVTQFDPNFVVVTSAGVFSTSAITSAGHDVSPNTTSIVDVNQKLSTINQHSNNESYFINRQPLRKIVPKMGTTTYAQPLSLKIEPTTPPTSVTRPTQQRPNISSQLPVTSPIARPLESPSSSPTLEIDESHSNSPNAVATSTNLQDQPLDLCTKNNSADSQTSSIQASTSQDIYDENEPLNLSKNRSLSYSDHSSSPNMHHLPRHEGLVGFWKTPPRSTFRGYRKPGETGSPLEGDTASETSANSPGLDNQTMPYGIFMSPNMNYAHGVVPIGQVSPKNRFLPEGFPEGAMILPGSPHYRLSHTMALQHNEPPTPERPYMCEECGATFKRNKSLKQHHRVHTSERPFKCGDCDKNFRYSSTLKQHEKIHTGMKPHTCEVCPRRFAHAEKLKRHVRIHSGEKPYICENEHCGKRFTDSSQLKLHMRTHSNHKPFACHYCPLRFKYSGDVKRHVRIHTGEKPYVCGYCKMRFTQSNTLKQHERTHTGERPYHCHKCGMTFTQSGSLKYHLAHRHPPDLAAFIITTSSPAVTSAPSSVGPQLA